MEGIAADLSLDSAIAITGMAGRFPGAANIGEFWDNLAAGRDTITRFTDEELHASGFDATAIRALPGFIASRGIVDQGDCFDRGFFGIGVKEAEIMDPQQRVFLETAWEALEDAGCDASRFPGLIGVFAGMSNNTYYANFVKLRRDLMEVAGPANLIIGNEKDFLATRLAYKLNLRGPALSIQTACSTALVSVCVACESLLARGCDIALAGGISLTVPQQRGYFYNEGGMTSNDGVCRPFDSRATGTVFSNGAGVVVLKRASEAIADGDPIYALIKGFATNNDGLHKVSFAAPSIDGQAEVIALAQGLAGISPETVSYIEAHGTATALGDPIEIAGLSQVFRTATDARQFCALGSVKGNIGHCDAASGATSLIKTALAFHHGQIPPSIHCEQLNPALEIEQSPFFINTELRPWQRTGTPRRAGVSSFGVGGTNAHVVLEEAPLLPQTTPGRPATPLLLSAKTAAALDARANSLADYLEHAPAQPLADIAWTLQTGRQVFQHRRAIIAHDAAETVAALRSPGRLAREDSRLDTRAAFLFPGQGLQYAGMGAGLHATEPVFRDAIDQCAEILLPELGCDLRDIIFATGDEAAARLKETRFTQPAIFAVDYALGRFWLSLGINPVALVGHSIGEWAAAALAGVFSLPDAARLVALRARLVNSLPGGAMLAVRSAEAALRETISYDPRLEVAAVNGRSLCVISGPFDAVDALEERLRASHVAARRLPTSHAFHSAMVEPVVAELEKAVAAVQLHAPELPIISTVTGNWLSAAEATDPHYWAAHLRVTVRFADALERLCTEHDGALLETGPGRGLSQLAFQCAVKSPGHQIVHSIDEGPGESAAIAEAIARLWLAGVPIDWTAVHSGETRRRVSGLPSYPFDRQRYFADWPAGTPAPLTTAGTDGQAPFDAEPAAFTAAPQSAAANAISPSAEPIPSEDATLAALRRQLGELAGIDLTSVPASTRLLELGFDSLFLSQVALALSRRFGLKITLGQLIRDFDSLESLAAHLAANATIRAAAPPSGSHAAPLSTPAQAPAGATVKGPFQPVRPDSAGKLTEPQQRWLADFIQRYNARTARSKAHTQATRQHFADPRAVSGFALAWKEMVYPIVSSRSAGSRIWDLDGNEWNDVTLSFGAAMLGHQPPFVVDAIQDQLAKGMELGPTSPIAGEVAALICELTGSERATFCNTGSEAVSGAVRIARTVTGRSRIVYFSGSYHGIDSEMLGRSPGANQLVPMPVAPGIPPEVLADVIMVTYGDPAAFDIIAANAGDIAAVLVEPIQSRHPDFQPADFLKQLRALTQQHGIALIFDEIISGFRCHSGGAQAYFGVKADIATYGKVLGGGMPIGIIAGRAEYMDAFDGGMWSFGDDSFPQAAMTFFAGTFVRQPLALAAALAVLKHFKAAGPALQETLASRTQALVATLNELLAGTPLRAERCASNWMVTAPPDYHFAPLLFAALRHRGIHIWQHRPCFISTAHDDAAIAGIITAFRESVAELADAGFISRSAAAGLPTTSAPNEPATIPLTPAQRELWFLCQHSAAASASCNETWVLRLTGPLDPAALKTALQTIVNRHDALRCTFDRLGETLTVIPALEIDVPLTDLSAATAPEREARFAEMLAEGGRHVFDLPKGPLLAVRIVRLTAQDHALLFNAHHLACDGWSCDVFLRELAELYSSASAGRSARLPAAMPLHEYQQWEQSLRTSADYAAEMDYWLNEYRTIPPPLDLPGDRTAPALRTFRGGTEQLLLPVEFVTALTRLGAQHGATFFTVLLAAYQALLHRLTGETDFAVGIPSAGQNNIPGGDLLIGHCVNMLPLRFQLDPARGFGDTLSALQGKVLDAFDHRRVTFGELLQKLPVPRLPGRVPLIPATFNLDPPMGRLEFSGLQHRLEAIPRQGFQFDFSISCDSTSAGLRTLAHYNADILDGATVQRWLALFRTILESILAQPSAALAEIPLLSAADSAVIEKASATARDYPRNVSLQGLVEAQVARTPAAIAVTAGAQSLTYAELNTRANSLAQRLQTLRVKRDVPVGVCLDRSLDLPVALLAVLKAGGAYVPIDPQSPADRVRFILQDCGARVVIATKDIASVFCTPEGPQFISPEAPAATASLDPAPTDPSALAYIIYTSGSTGRPKGAMIPHAAICNHMQWMQEEFPLGPADRVLQKTPISFDASVWEFWAPLIAGATLVMAPHDAHRDSRRLIESVNSSQATILQVVPSMLRMLVSEPRFADCKTLRRLFAGGENLTPDLCDRVLKTLPCDLINLYGPTECAIDTLFHRCVRGATRVPIGRPVANTRLQVLDANGQPVPIGVPGELYISGPQLARGYISNPELTTAKFTTLNGERVYKTGDLVRWLPQGEIQFLGRNDAQVKIRGNRIELGEIEAQLQLQPGIAECAVAVHDDRLIGYLVPKPGAVIATAGLPAALAASLPSAMIPSNWIILDKLPLTPSGKLDRRALPAPSLRDAKATPPTPPRTPLEREIAAIWSSVLALEQVGIHDNFFELGGESLLGLRVLNRLRDLLTQDISLALIFQAPTIAALASRLEADYPAETASVAITTTGDTPPDTNGHTSAGPKAIPRIPRLARQPASNG